MQYTPESTRKRTPIVTLDGVNITKFGYFADDETGEVRMYAHKPGEPITILTRGYDAVPTNHREALPNISPDTEIVGLDEDKGYIVRGKVQVTFNDEPARAAE